MSESRRNRQIPSHSDTNVFRHHSEWSYVFLVGLQPSEGDLRVLTHRRCAVQYLFKCASQALRPPGERRLVRKYAPEFGRNYH